MKKYLVIFLLGLVLNSFAQDTKVESRLVYYAINDSIIDCNRLFSEEIINENGEQIYEKKYPYPSRHKNEFRLFQRIKNSNNSIYISCVEGDSMTNSYLFDSINGYNYIISEADTMKYQAWYSKSQLIKEKCISGCEYSRHYRYNKFGFIDSIIDVNKEKDTSYILWKYDSVGRVIYQSWLTPKMKNSPYISIEYDDINNFKLEEYGNEDLSDFVQTIKTYMDKNHIPTKKELITISDNETIKQTIIYKIVE
jgi:hypothetical protein